MYRSLSVMCFTFAMMLFGFCETGNAQILCGKLRGILRGSNCCPQSCNPCPTQVCPSCVDPCCQGIQIMRTLTSKEQECRRCCLVPYPNQFPPNLYWNCVEACKYDQTLGIPFCNCTNVNGNWVCQDFYPEGIGCNCCPPTRRFRLFGR